MKEVENMAKEIASKYNINLYGSFFLKILDVKKMNFSILCMRPRSV